MVEIKQSRFNEYVNDDKYDNSFELELQSAGSKRMFELLHSLIGDGYSTPTDLLQQLHERKMLVPKDSNDALTIYTEGDDEVELVNKQGIDVKTVKSFGSFTEYFKFAEENLGISLDQSGVHFSLYPRSLVKFAIDELQSRSPGDRLEPAPDIKSKGEMVERQL